MSNSSKKGVTIAVAPILFIKEDFNEKKINRKERK